jgi:hypothetical protein
MAVPLLDALAGSLLHPETPVRIGFLGAPKAAAPALGFEVIALGVHTKGIICDDVSEFNPISIVLSGLSGALNHATPHRRDLAKNATCGQTGST